MIKYTRTDAVMTHATYRPRLKRSVQPTMSCQWVCLSAEYNWNESECWAEGPFCKDPQWSCEGCHVGSYRFIIQIY